MQYFGSNASIIYHFTGVLAIAQVGAAASLETPVTIPGAQVGDLVLYAARQANTQGVSWSPGRVSAANTAQLRTTNGSAAPITPTATNSYDVYLLQMRGSAS